MSMPASIKSRKENHVHQNMSILALLLFHCNIIQNLGIRYFEKYHKVLRNLNQAHKKWNLH